MASRAVAWHVLRRVHADQAWSGPVVDAELRASGLDERDRQFAANLAYSTLRWEGVLDWALAGAVSRPLHDVQPEVLDVLRLGAWQLLYGGTPDRAAVDTAVELARAKIGAHVAGFVNGALRGLARRRDTLPWPDPANDEGLGLQLGYPAWVIAEARRRFGDRAEAVLAAGNTPADLTLRAAGDRESLIAELTAAGLHAARGITEEAVHVSGVAALGGVTRIPAVSDGRASVQDEASMIVVRAAAHDMLRRDEPWTAADLCAAPGGKSTHLAQLGAGVAASDVLHSRARLIASAAVRTTAVTVVVADARRPPYRPASFDVVLLDAPCTGLGVVRRRPELRWRREAADVARLAQLQGELLEAAVTLVRPGGTLLYSVCTWTVAETAGVVSSFLALNGDLVEAVDTPTGGHGSILGGGPGVQLDPDLDGTDGMFLCRFRRRP